MPFPSAYALLVGVGTYQYVPYMNVPTTVADVQAVATVLRDPQHCGYPSDHVTLLADTAATRAGILEALDGLAAQAGEDATVTLFYSGHGHYGTDGTYYLTTS